MLYTNGWIGVEYFTLISHSLYIVFYADLWCLLPPDHYELFFYSKNKKNNICFGVSRTKITAQLFLKKQNKKTKKQTHFTFKGDKVKFLEILINSHDC